MKAQTKKISELASVIPGFSPKPDERKSKGKYLLIGGRNISGGKLTATEKDSFVDEVAKDSFERAKAIPGDIIVSTLFDIRKVYIYQTNDLPGVVNNSCAIIRSGEQSDYIVSFLKTIHGKEEFLEKAKQATSGACIPRLSIKSLADIQVPILPVAELALLGDNRIQNSSNDELVKLRNELAKKETEIAKLKGEHLERELFLQNRLQVIEAQIETNDLAFRIRSGETATLEFKSTLRWNIHTKNNDPKIENSVLKTIVAFCNSKGGELLIGVSNEGGILGLEQDCFPDHDRFLLHLGNLIRDRIVPNIVEFVEYKIIPVGDKHICNVTCKRSTKEVWLKPTKDSDEQFFIRQGPSSEQLKSRDAFEYIRDHFGR